MQLLLAHRDVEGSCADLFFYPADGRLYKLFRGTPGTTVGRRNRAVFDAEVAAYALLQDSASLLRHSPAYYGTVDVCAVLTADGRHVHGRYLLDCCYSTDLLPGPCVKVFGVPDEYQGSVLALMARFENAGIQHVADADVNGWESPTTMKLLDFATYDALARYG
jgi:hypothetical protein